MCVRLWVSMKHPSCKRETLCLSYVFLSCPYRRCSNRYVKTKIASKQLGDNSPLKRVEPAKAELYHTWANSALKNRAANERLASSPDVTTDAIVDAITSPRPRTRYAVAVGPGGIPAQVFTWLAWLVPDRLQDIITTGGPV